MYSVRLEGWIGSPSNNDLNNDSHEAGSVSLLEADHVMRTTRSTHTQTHTGEG